MSTRTRESPRRGETGAEQTEQQVYLEHSGTDRRVLVDTNELAALRRDAHAWRMLNRSPHVAALLAEYVEWHRRRDMSDSTAAMSAMLDIRALANVPTYAELQRRRNTYDREPLTPEQITLQARASWAAYEGRVAP